MATLPTIDFSSIASTAKAALVAYGTPALFQEKDSATWREIKAVVYKDEKAQQFLGDASSMFATAVLNPDDFLTRFPRKFDRIRVEAGGFQRTYNVESVHPIPAQSTLPLLLVQLVSN